MQVLVVNHQLTMPDLTVEDFTDALQSLFVSNLAVAWSVPATNVEITSFEAGSLVVNAEVAVAEKSEALSAQDQDAAEAKLSGAFDADEFGTVTAVRNAQTPQSSRCHVDVIDALFGFVVSMPSSSSSLQPTSVFTSDSPSSLRAPMGDISCGDGDVLLMSLRKGLFRRLTSIPAALLLITAGDHKVGAGDQGLRGGRPRGALRGRR